jgi:hypothetical protein
MQEVSGSIPLGSTKSSVQAKPVTSCHPVSASHRFALRCARDDRLPSDTVIGAVARQPMFHVK